ncbi:FAD-dependent oxidoreductase [Pseudooceanicola sp.]|uniref:NAD(P)/FAD-dependent oxidoreductase n=1 Tax=Pseudooceanicola sp. TaxID=1914328 RepID=UPI0026200322|nr:FAD-dependent oxidoreductase [Pseudooceanicola sp.]MDF1854705.1 FAD-dependent oxidoreductase [Pseudooceanicola sp.]
MDDLFDVLIIGGGVAGVAAAARLSPLGKTLLVESEPALAYHASGRSAAMFLKAYGNPAVRALNEASEDYLTRSDTGILSPRPVLLIARPGEEVAFQRESAEFGFTRISLKEARALVPILHPDRVALAAWRKDSSALDTDLLIQNFARTARAHGAELRLNAPVSAISRDGALWRVRAGAQEVRARRLVNAAGAWADPVAEMAGVPAIGITPYRRSMAQIPAPGELDLSGWPFIDALGERWYAKPDAGKLIVSPAEAHPMPPHDAFADDMVLAEGLARYEEMVTEPVTRVEHSWAGLRSFAPDRALVIGPDPDAPDFLWFAGQGGYGFQTAAAASQLLADLADGRPPSLPAAVVTALSPARFR